MKIVFMGTPEFAVPSLVSLHESGYTVDLVITQEDKPKGRGKKLQATPVKEKALELGFEVYQPKNVNSKESVEKIKALDPDFIVVVAYGQIIRKSILEIPKYDIINVHASLLPKYRGAAPINWSIIDGEKETGVTIMEIQEGLDTGDMILKESIAIEDEDDAITITEKLSKLGGKMLPEAILGLVDGSLSKKKQDDSLSSYASMMNKELGHIDWNKSAFEIRNLIRGLKPWPSAFTYLNDEIVKIHGAEVSDEDIEVPLGQIVRVDKEYIYIKCGQGLLKVFEIQFPNKKKMLVADYLKGNSIESGIVFK